jgi:hypothetical protein
LSRSSGKALTETDIATPFGEKKGSLLSQSSGSSTADWSPEAWRHLNTAAELRKPNGAARGVSEAAAKTCTLHDPPVFLGRADSDLKLVRLAEWRRQRFSGVNTTEFGRFEAANRSSRMARLLPWVVLCLWLMGTLFAFWFFRLRLPQVFWCGATGG